MNQFTIEWNCGQCDETHSVTLSGPVAEVMSCVIFAHLTERNFEATVFYTDTDGNRSDRTTEINVGTLVLVTMGAI